MSHVVLTWLCEHAGLARCYADGGGPPGPYEAFTAISRHPDQPQLALVHGLDQDVSRKDLRAFLECLRDENFTAAGWKRHRPDGRVMWQFWRLRNGRWRFSHEVIPPGIAP